MSIKAELIIFVGNKRNGSFCSSKSPQACVFPLETLSKWSVPFSDQNPLDAHPSMHIIRFSTHEPNKRSGSLHPPASSQRLPTQTVPFLTQKLAIDKKLNKLTIKQLAAET